MKKVLLISLLAMMLISMVVLSACGPKEEVVPEETEVMEEAAPVVDTTLTEAPAEEVPAEQAQ